MSSGPVVIDTMIAGWLINRSEMIAPYRPHVTGRQLVVSFVTVGELRFGALAANWGERRRQDLDSRLSSMEVIRPDNDLVDAYARMRATCKHIGHGLQAKHHEADRWIAATAIRYGLQLISDDVIFSGVPGLIHICEARTPAPSANNQT